MSAELRAFIDAVIVPALLERLLTERAAQAAPAAEPEGDR
jgi:hypothetical protein